MGRLVKEGMEIFVEKGACGGTLISDQAHRAVRATVAADAESLYGPVEVSLKVLPRWTTRRWTGTKRTRCGKGRSCSLCCSPCPNLGRRLADRGLDRFSMESIPRIVRAQSMDALSSMASIAGYRAALITASALGKIFLAMMTAVGTLVPAKGLVLEVGVAGLQAITTAHRPGAVMCGYDVRPLLESTSDMKSKDLPQGESYINLDLILPPRRTCF